MVCILIILDAETTLARLKGVQEEVTSRIIEDEFAYR
jgi:hypothetical protein